MNWKLVTLLSLVGLAVASADVHANSLVGADKKKQSFVLSPKKKAKSFIDFGKLGKKPGLGRVQLKSKAKAKQKKKPDVKLKLGPPVPAPSPTNSGQGHEVSVELVALSLVSLNPVSLDPFLDDKDQRKGQGLTDNIVLTLSGPAKKLVSPAKLDKDAEKKKRKGKKGKGKVDIKLNKKLKVAPKNKKKTKAKKLPKKKFKALDVPFAFASPITITDPDFCLENGDAAAICLKPMNPIPLPGSLTLMGPVLAALLLGHIVRRRRVGGAGSGLFAIGRT